MSQNKKQKNCAVNTAFPAQRRQFCYVALWWYVCYWLFRLHTGCWVHSSCTYHGNRVAVMSVGPYGRVLSIGTEEDLFAYGWEWKAVIWLRGHQLMHPEQPHVHRASFIYAAFSVTLNSRLFWFVLFRFFSSSLWNLNKRGGLWRLWLFSCLWERAESLVTPPLLALTLLKCALLSRKWSLHFLFFFFYTAFVIAQHSFPVYLENDYLIFSFLWEGQSILMDKALHFCTNVYFLGELCRYTGVNNSANIRPSSPMLINDNTENIFREFYLWKAVCTT